MFHAPTYRLAHLLADTAWHRPLVVIAKVGHSTGPDSLVVVDAVRPSRNRVLHEGSNSLAGQDLLRTTGSRRGERTHREWGQVSVCEPSCRTVRIFPITTSGERESANATCVSDTVTSIFHLNSAPIPASAFLILHRTNAGPTRPGRRLVRRHGKGPGNSSAGIGAAYPRAPADLSSEIGAPRWRGSPMPCRGPSAARGLGSYAGGQRCVNRTITDL